jgi:uncharacterized alpha-E superfamily protein
VEEADHLARLLDVHVAVYLDRPGALATDYWDRFMALCGIPCEPEIGEEPARELTLDAIRERVGRARALAISVRPSLSSEFFQRLNFLYFQVQEPPLLLHDFLLDIEFGAHLLTGLSEDSMIHDTAWDFMRLGRYQERALNVTRLVLRHLKEIGDDPVLWAGVLKCCWAFEAFRGRYSAPVTVPRVVEFLLLDRELPRSAGFAVREALAAVGRIERRGGHQSAPQRVLGRLSSLFDYADASEIALAPEAFADEVTDVFEALDRALAQAYFRPSRVVQLQAPALLPAEHSQQ